MREDGYREYLLHHDNATPHTSTITLAATGETHTDMLAHAPCSPALAPNDLFLYPYLKAKMRGTQYRNIQQVQEAAVQFLRQIPQDKFEDAIKELHVHCAKCVMAEGDYYEGDGIEILDFMVKFSESGSESEEFSDDQ